LVVVEPLIPLDVAVVEHILVVQAFVVEEVVEHIPVVQTFAVEEVVENILVVQAFAVEEVVVLLADLLEPTIYS
jgi:hypothetical protein